MVTDATGLHGFLLPAATGCITTMQYEAFFAMKDQKSSSKTAKATLGRLELRCPPLPQTLLEATKLIDVC